MDCGNNPCDFAVSPHGQRTSGRCRCWDSLPKMDPETRVAVRRIAAELRARIAALESQLADRHAERVREIDAHMERVAELDAEIERLRADLVWSVRKGVMVGHDENLRPCVWFDVHRGVECDDTPDSICRAVREARDGE